MVLFRAKREIAVDNSDLSELDGYRPFGSQGSPGIQSKFKPYPDQQEGELTVKVAKDGAHQYKLRIWDTSPKDGNALFKGGDVTFASDQADMLYGYKGRDDIYGREGDDAIFGGKGGDHVYGGADATIFGGAGNDYLSGSGGARLTGGAGKDAFGFYAALGVGNGAAIEDFAPGDRIKLSRSFFEGIGLKGELPAGQFFLASDHGGQAKSVIYDDATGNLSYAQNGGDAQVFGRIANGAALSHEDFLIA